MFLWLALLWVKRFRLGKYLYKFVWVCTDLDEVRKDFDRFVLWTVSKILVMFIAIYHDLLLQAALQLSVGFGLCNYR